MPITPEELSRRLEEGARALVLLRRATREMSALGQEVLARRRGRRDGLRGSRRRGTPRR